MRRLNGYRLAFGAGNDFDGIVLIKPDAGVQIITRIEQREITLLIQSCDLAFSPLAVDLDPHLAVRF